MVGGRDEALGDTTCQLSVCPIKKIQQKLLSLQRNFTHLITADGCSI